MREQDIVRRPGDALLIGRVRLTVEYVTEAGAVILRVESPPGVRVERAEVADAVKAEPLKESA